MNSHPAARPLGGVSVKSDFLDQVFVGARNRHPPGARGFASKLADGCHATEALFSEKPCLEAETGPVRHGFPDCIERHRDAEQCNGIGVMRRATFFRTRRRP